MLMTTIVMAQAPAIIMPPQSVADRASAGLGLSCAVDAVITWCWPIGPGDATAADVVWPAVPCPLIHICIAKMPRTMAITPASVSAVLKRGEDSVRTRSLPCDGRWFQVHTAQQLCVQSHHNGGDRHKDRPHSR